MCVYITVKREGHVPLWIVLIVQGHSQTSFERSRDRWRISAQLRHRYGGVLKQETGNSIPYPASCSQMRMLYRLQHAGCTNRGAGNAG